MLLDFTVIAQYQHQLLVGAGWSLVIAFASLLIGLSVGMVIALGRQSPLAWVRSLAKIYTEFFRTVPPLVLIVWCYFVLPQVLKVELSSYTAATIALGFNIAAFFAENFRAGIQSVNPGQFRACRILGISSFDAWRLVILPQAIRATMGPTATTIVLLIKSTSLASFIGALELMRVGQLISIETFQPIEVLTVVAFVYFVITYPILVVSRRLENDNR